MYWEAGRRVHRAVQGGWEAGTPTNRVVGGIYTGWWVPSYIPGWYIPAMPPRTLRREVYQAMPPRTLRRETMRRIEASRLLRVRKRPPGSLG